VKKAGVEDLFYMYVSR